MRRAQGRPCEEAPSGSRRGDRHGALAAGGPSEMPREWGWRPLQGSAGAPDCSRFARPSLCGRGESSRGRSGPEGLGAAVTTLFASRTPPSLFPISSCVRPNHPRPPVVVGSSSSAASPHPPPPTTTHGATRLPERRLQPGVRRQRLHPPLLLDERDHLRKDGRRPERPARPHDHELPWRTRRTRHGRADTAG